MSRHSLSFPMSFTYFDVSLNFAVCFLTLMLHLLSKISQLTAMPTSTSSDLIHRQERANAFCEAIRALDATGLLHDIF